MSSEAKLSARDAALLRLDAMSLPNWRARSLKRTPVGKILDPRDEALAETIYISVVKNLLLIQRMIEHYSGKRLKQIDPGVQKVLAVAMVQVRFLSRVPGPVAVDEAVEQTRRLRLGRAGGFVNAVLRKMVADTTWDPQFEPESMFEMCEQLHSHPMALVKKLSGIVKDSDLVAICKQHNAEPPTVIRLTSGVDTSDLLRGGVEIIPHETKGFAVVRGAARADFADWANRGVAQVQDSGTATLVQALPIKNGMNVLDRCCGHGTKTLQLSQMVGPRGRVMAMDSSVERVQSLQRVLRRREIENVETRIESTVAAAGLEPDSFDLVLIDAPCSNSGVLARRAEARYRQTPRHLESLALAQKQLLKDSASVVAPGGYLAYMTCSVWTEENQVMADWFLKKHKKFSLGMTITHELEVANSATSYRDGGFMAVFVRAQ